MVATLSVYLDTGGSNGSPGTSTDVDALGPPSLRLKTADNPTIDTNHPVPIPTSGTNYSYVKNCYVKVDVAPDTQIDNFRIYTDGAGFGTGITTNIGLQFPTRNSGSTAAYLVATGTQGTTGTEMTALYSGTITSVGDLFSYTSGSPLSGPSISETGNKLDAIGETTNYFVIQAAVTSTATPGNKTDETITLLYDEI